LVRTAGEDARPTMAERSLTFEVTLPDAPRVVLGDATRLSQIVGNLLNNACKFTDPGGSIRMTLDAPPEAKEAVLVVEDTGIGMDPGILSRLFDIFSQADHSLERSRGGLGLGLSLVKGLAEAHGGSVRAESDGPGRGARLTVTLPLDASPAAPERDARSEPSPKPKPTARSVLVIEDNADAAETTQALLELEGHQVAVASNGADALATAKQSRPDIVLCDIGLAGAMDGYAVAKVFRATPELRNTYLVAVSGYGTEQDVRSARDAGFDAHLTKPVLPERLAEVVANLHA